VKFPCSGADVRALMGQNVAPTSVTIVGNVEIGPSCIQDSFESEGLNGATCPFNVKQCALFVIEA
jgi:hypothetical protein